MKVTVAACKDNVSVCGKEPSWYGAKWKTDKETLEKLRPCYHCERLWKFYKEKENEVQK